MVRPQIEQSWRVSFMSSTQNGMRQHPRMHPTKHNEPATNHVNKPACGWVLVKTIVLQNGHTVLTGWLDLNFIGCAEANPG